MEIKKIDLTVAVSKDKYPTNNLSEIAFVGRSNVGKSSLINTLLKKKIAKVSQNPGKTRTINFYNVNEIINLVDLPGYGYAKAPKSEIEKWGKMIEKYLENRNELKMIALLLDIRHLPTENDKMMYNWLLHYNYEVVIVATKLDKIKRSQINKHISQIKNSLLIKNENNQNLDLEIITFSSLEKKGIEDLWDTMLNRCNIS
ncbi:MAG: ribosome biogenesis GTP-binding protein YihA/YsxC [Defluviitaleaceae bacterium]|nr:ribosome biogenesis GTP-binding protein YihA/YsxC [Defluviitaleaceae bacterium]